MEGCIATSARENTEAAQLVIFQRPLTALPNMWRLLSAIAAMSAAADHESVAGHLVAQWYPFPLVVQGWPFWVLGSLVTVTNMKKGTPKL